jgi:hypothetical protein
MVCYDEWVARCFKSGLRTMKTPTILGLVCSLVLNPFPAWASGSLAAIKQRQMMEQEAYQQAVAQEMIKRQQQEMINQYMVAYQQAAVAQYVEAQKQAIMVAAAQQQMAAQYMAQQMAQQIAAYKEATIRRQQMMAQQEMFKIKVAQNAQIQQYMMAQQANQYMQQAAVAQAVAANQQQRFAEYSQALVQKSVAEKLAYDQVQTVRAVKGAQEAQDVMTYQAAQAMQERDQNKLYEDIPSSFVKDVVGVSALWKSLDATAKAWTLVIDKKAKGVTIKHYIDELAKEGAAIRKDPLYYAQVIDDMARENPRMLDQPFKDILRIVAIIDYDYDNGTDKDALARRIFPDERAFQANKKRVEGQ